MHAISSDRVRTRGFTLLELLVAITLLAILAVLAWRGLDSMTRTHEALAQRDERIEALKTAYAQFDADCTQLADPATLSRSPVEVDADRVLLVRDRRDEGQPPAWQVVLYRAVNGQLERLQSAPLTNRGDLRGALDSLRQGGANAAVYKLADAVDGIAARAWIEPGGWMDNTGALSAALFPGGSNTTTLAELLSASAVSASAPAANGVVVPVTTVRAVELALLVRMTPQGTPQRFTRICMTGL
ncbi:PulJ/GspJ family protein [Ralstonia solanacearum]|uniref:PulJ/GspJ family protein n=1 Tax=Ralstonia solanacearum TaxID=305 RepID=UPI0005ACAA09|nr:type II secretion system protein J [Ralstonia solanacearum]MCL9827234.1 type II secretion system protein J [Ralstonia solanacearum]MCL9832026.1 type II secretion system protein J [Ralstonia solanacearum]MCL9836807.1 type II secretion system protein J [Ralstonia solanacearum]OAI74749.1 general secretion pathway protein GspJ [Ralstonia solanacearum]